MTSSSCVSLVEKDNFLRIVIQGRFDFSVHRAFKGLVDNVCEDERKLIVDLTEAHYLDSSALGMLLNLKDRRISSMKDAPSIVGATGTTLDVLKIAHFDRLFSIA